MHVPGAHTVSEDRGESEYTEIQKLKNGFASIYRRGALHTAFEAGKRSVASSGRAAWEER